MTQVVVVEFDEALRGTLHVVLSDEGHYEVTEVTTEEVALAYLADCPEGVVVVCIDTPHAGRQGMRRRRRGSPTP